MNSTAYDVARQFLGLEEVEGAVSNPAILAMLKLDAKWVEDDSTPWCSAFVNTIAWLLGLPRSSSLAARSWLEVGSPVDMIGARRGYDVVILKRGKNAPGPEVLKAPGHVGFFAGHRKDDNDIKASRVLILGGNQGDAVTIAPFRYEDVLGVRRLA